MGTVYKETYTKPLPADAELFTRKGQRFARWKDAKGKTRTARVTTPTKGKNAGVDRLIIESSTYTARYRDGSGVVRKVATGCRDETAARQILADLVKRAEHVKAEIITPSQDAVADHQGTPLNDHIESYIAHLGAKGVTQARIKTSRSRLTRVAEDCRFRLLPHLNAQEFEHWLVQQQTQGMSASARNGYRESWIAFANWCKQNYRLVVNPFSNVPKANEKADPRRQRRALTEPELIKLLRAAQQRPFLDAMTIRRGKNKGQTIAVLSEETRNQLEQLGRERALIYKTLVLTGLRKNELASLTVGQLELDGPVTYAVLHAADEKNRQGSEIPIRDDLAEDLCRWLDGTLDRLRTDARKQGDPIPTRLPLSTPLFYVPTGLVRILNRDLKAAGIVKRDERGKTIDVHAMRHTYGTHLSKGGVPLRTAQAAMRHSDPKLTANVYTDPKLLDVAGALDSLPSLPLDNQCADDQQVATGTYQSLLVPVLVPVLVPNTDESGTSGSSHGRDLADTIQRRPGDKDRVSVEYVKRKRPLSCGDNERHKIGVTGFEPAASSPRTKRSTKLSYTP